LLSLTEVWAITDASRVATFTLTSGGHNLLVVGPPGTGKTLLARSLRTILPPLTFEEALETTAVHRVAGILSADKGVVDVRPFGAPHPRSERGRLGRRRQLSKTGGSQPGAQRSLVPG
jgi:predicted ATPase with chaperone activity